MAHHRSIGVWTILLASALVVHCRDFDARTSLDEFTGGTTNAGWSGADQGDGGKLGTTGSAGDGPDLGDGGTGASGDGGASPTTPTGGATDGGSPNDAEGGAGGGNEHLWIPTGLCAHSVAGEYILSCEAHPDGWWVKTVSGMPVGDGAGTSIEVSNDGVLWIADGSSRIRRWTGQAWELFDNQTLCEGGALTIRQIVGDTALAVGTGTNLFVISDAVVGPSGNEIRAFNGTCWERMDKGEAREIAIFAGERPWVINNAGTPFVWNGFDWGFPLPDGIATSVARNGWVVGNDLASIWRWSGSSWSRDTSWPDRAVSYVRDVGRCGGWAIGPDNSLFRGDCAR